MDFRNECTNLADYLNKVETSLLDISNSVIMPDNGEKMFSLDFLRRMKEGIGLIRLIKSQCNFYSLEQWEEREKGVDYLVPHYVIVDKKGVERFRVTTGYCSHEFIWLTEICNSYNCRGIAIRSDLVSRVINRNNLLVKEGGGWIKVLSMKMKQKLS